MEQVRNVLALRHYSERTATAYMGWIRRFIQFHNRTHPQRMGEPEVSAFLSALATTHRVGASTQNQALAAVLFLYSDVLHRELAAGVRPQA
jgi:hypothetical protein